MDAYDQLLRQFGADPRCTLVFDSNDDLAYDAKAVGAIFGHVSHPGGIWGSDVTALQAQVPQSCRCSTQTATNSP